MQHESDRPDYYSLVISRSVDEMPTNTRNVAKTYTTGSVVSKDGTTIGYRQLGSGPGIILLHAGRSSLALAELAGLEWVVSARVVVREPPRRVKPIRVKAIVNGRLILPHRRVEIMGA